MRDEWNLFTHKQIREWAVRLLKERPDSHRRVLYELLKLDFEDRQDDETPTEYIDYQSLADKQYKNN